MKRLLLGFGLAAGFAYAVREWFGAPTPQPIPRGPGGRWAELTQSMR